MVNRRDTLKLAAGAALGLQAAPAVAAEGQETTTDEEETTTVEDDLSGIFLAGATGGQEVPPVETEAQGTAVFAVNDDSDGVDYAVAVQDIENVNQAHIHLGEVGENGEIVVWLYPAPDEAETALIEDEYDGMLASGTFADDDLTGPLEGESIEAAVQAMEDGSTYVNIHTEQNPAGEVRGQIVTVDRMVDCLGFEQQATTTPAEEDETTTEEEDETTAEEEEETTVEEEEETTVEEEEETTVEEEEETTVEEEAETTVEEEETTTA